MFPMLKLDCCIPEEEDAGSEVFCSNETRNGRRAQGSGITKGAIPGLDLTAPLLLDHVMAANSSIVHLCILLS